MHKVYWVITGLLAFFSFSATAQTMQPATGDSLTLDQSLVYYQSLLAKDRLNPVGNYGMACYYYIKNDFVQSAGYARKALKKPSDLRDESYLIYASCMDARGFASDAYKILTKAVNEFPSDYTLLYHHALSAYKMRALAEARQSLNRSVLLEPYFVPHHLLLSGVLYEQENHPLAPLSLLYSLLIDADMMRNQQVLYFTYQLFKSNHDRISLPLYEKRYALTSADALIIAYNGSDAALDASFSVLEFVNDLTIFLKEKTQTTPTGDAALAFYQPFFARLIEQGQLQTFAYYILRNSNKPEITRWVKNHPDQMDAFALWLEKNLPEVENR